MLYRVLKLVFFIPIVGWILRPRLMYGERIPEQGAAIIAANHISCGDTFSLPTLMKRQLRFAAKRELFEMRGLKALLGVFLRAIGQVPLDRSGGRQAANGLRPLLQVLAQGELVGIFPEGTRSPDGRMYRSHTGVARLALLSGAPVIPVGMVNTQLRRWFIFPTMRQARIVVGRPLDFSRYADRVDDVMVLRWVANEIARSIQALTGQSYVDLYGSRLKKGRLTQAQADSYIKAHPNEGVTSPDDIPILVGAGGLHL
ncbi:MAG: 1-acyl-sn-glycerol-3-phosphate acyltransferase [Propionibacteriaceae bacterium]|jgi:1-acyl-sn-glycerol-3-phosphate acyltransferase|nr:1-acyl-sn-glycerol-3-phosphate acyltransferase [Propionibacteriaceae bacterium]